MKHPSLVFRGRLAALCVFVAAVAAVTGCRQPVDSRIIPMPPVQITVTVTPAGEASPFQGGSVGLAALVTNAPVGYGLDWKIVSNGHGDGTGITDASPTGARLVISRDEPADAKITVMAALSSDASRFGEHTFTVLTAPFTVESVTVTPAAGYSATVARGGDAVFEAAVVTDPADHPDVQGTVRWEIVDRKSVV